MLPSAAKIDAYSMPITPAPTTTNELGTDFKFRMPSESTTCTSSNAMFEGRAGLVPVAMTMLSALTRTAVP